MRHGTVQHWRDDSGYGFIRPAGGGGDVFVHRTKLPPGIETLLLGSRVTFTLVKTPRGERAENVYIEADTAARWST